MDKQKLIKELFVGKVADILGDEKTRELLKEATDAINEVSRREQMEKISKGLVSYLFLKTENI